MVRWYRGICVNGEPEDVEPFTDGEWYEFHIKHFPAEFKDFVDEITGRFKGGEWQGDNAETVKALIDETGEQDRGRLYMAMAIDAFIAGASDAEYNKFVSLSRYDYDTRREVAHKTGRGFSNGKYLGPWSHV